jgi:hypothetical protein
MNSAQNPQYVYVFRLATFYKIGCSKNPAHRMRRIAGAVLPFEYELIHVIESRNSRALEKALHLLFQEKRVRGEWFELTPQEVDVLKQITLANEHQYVFQASQLLDTAGAQHRYPGRTYRERERIKRKCLRLKAKLTRMSPLERQALIAVVLEMQNEFNSNTK